MEQGYSNITLIDCNRQNSEEGKSQNFQQPAQFTNKVGTGLKLNVGDKVAVHSGFVSERGAGSATIEFTGRSLGQEYTLSQSYLIPSQNLNNGAFFDTVGTAAEPRERYTQETTQTPQPYRNGCVSMLNVASNYPTVDNVGHMEISYYKTSNGEGYCHLPRIFDFYRKDGEAKNGNGSDVQIANFDYTNVANNQITQTDLYKVMTGDKNWVGKTTSYQDCYFHGMTMPLWVNNDIKNAPAQNLGGMVAQPSMRCFDDTHWFGMEFINESDNGVLTGGQEWNNGNAIKPYWSIAGYTTSATEYDPNPVDMGTIAGFKYRNDNTRYTIYVKDITYYASYGQVAITANPDVRYTHTVLTDGADIRNTSPSRKDFFLVDITRSTTQTSRFHRDPALSEYVRYKETKTVSVPKGHSNPSNVADELTNQLNKGEDTNTGGDGTLQPIEAVIGGMSDTVSGDKTTSGISAKKTSQTFKTFGCANYVSFQKGNSRKFFGGKAVAPTNVWGTTDKSAAETAVIDYMSSYHAIGVKRPELFDATRDVAKNCYARKIGAGESDLATGDYLSGDYAWMDIEYPTARNQIVYQFRKTEPFITGIEWTDDNLKYMKKWFDVQGQHPELFVNIRGTNILDSTSDSLYHSGVNIRGHNADNSRFIHVNSQRNGWMSGEAHLRDIPGGYLNAGDYASLGGDNYWTDTMEYNATGISSSPINQQSRPYWCWFDSSRRDILDGGETEDNMYGGYFYKRLDAGKYYIALSTKYIGGTPQQFWTGLDSGSPDDSNPYVPTDTDEWGPVKAGADVHFSAYGTDCIMLYAGYTNADIMEGINEVLTPAEFTATTAYNVGSGANTFTTSTADRIRERYVGAVNPEVSFDDKSSRFNFQRLHTPEHSGNPVNAGIDEEIPILGSESGNEVYKINKRILKGDFCPDLQGYVGFFKYQINTAAVATDPKTPKEYSNIYLFNPNLEKWKTYDADCGIFIEDFGVSEEKWSNSFWGILGFTWEQFNNNTVVDRQHRSNDESTMTIGSSFTTNANVESGDMNKLRVNIFGAVLYTNQVPVQMSMDGDKKFNGGIPIAPAITNTAVSSQINAERLPRKMINPYFLIRSNIVGDNNYQGGVDGGQLLPIVYVVNKENGFGDFYFQSSSQLEFTITESRMLTEISTSIHNPDMTLATVDNTSAIIYKITKQIATDLNVAQSILQMKNTARNYLPAVNPENKSLYDGIGQ